MDIRPGERRDLEGINEIYNHYVRTSPATFDLDEISKDARRAWFDAFGGRYRLLVAVEGDRVDGYACSKPLFERRAYETTVVTSVYVRDDARGRGLGRALYTALFGAIAEEDIHRANAGITLPNDASVALHRAFGFEEVARFSEQGRKFDRYWDVAWFEKAL